MDYKSRSLRGASLTFVRQATSATVVRARGMRVSVSISQFRHQSFDRGLTPGGCRRCRRRGGDEANDPACRPSLRRAAHHGLGVVPVAATGGIPCATLTGGGPGCDNRSARCRDVCRRSRGVARSRPAHRVPCETVVGKSSAADVGILRPDTAAAQRIRTAAHNLEQPEVVAQSQNGGATWSGLSNSVIPGIEPPTWMRASTRRRAGFGL